MKTPRSICRIASLLPVLMLLVLSGTAVGDSGFTPFASREWTVQTFWDDITVVLGEVEAFNGSSITVRVIDRVGDKGEGSPTLTLAYPQSEEHSNWEPFGERLEPQKGMRLAIPVTEEAGRLCVFTWFQPGLCDSIVLPIRTDRSDLDAVRRMKELTPNGLVETRTAELYEGLSSGDEWIRLFCLDALYILYLFQETADATKFLAPYPVSLEQMLTAVLAMAVEPRYTPLERLTAARVLFMHHRGYYTDKICEGLSALVRDESILVNQRVSALEHMRSFAPAHAVDIHLEVARNRANPTELRAEGTLIGNLGYPSQLDRGDAETWRTRGREIAHALADLLDDPDREVRGSAASALADAAVAGGGRAAPLRSLDRSVLEERLASETDPDVRQNLARLVKALRGR